MSRRTPLYEAHVAAGAKMVEFAGWQMPVQYAGVIEEHTAVRTAAGLFDVSHMGEVFLTGPNAIAATQRLITNDIGKVADGQAVYAGLLYESGGFVDDVIAYRFDGRKTMLCVNAANCAKDVAWVTEHPFGAAVEDRSDDFAQVAIQGPKAAAIVGRLTRLDLPAIGTYRFAEGEVAGATCILARTGYTGEDGFEVYCAPGKARALWDALLDAGRADGLAPCGLGARDSLRLEMKYALYGNDIDADHTPLEAGLGWIVKFDKGEFVGRAALEKQRAALGRKLVGFTTTDRGIPRHGYPILKDGATVGVVTSGTQSPSLKKPIGMGYVPVPLSKEGSTFDVEIRGKAVSCVVVKTPFYTPKR